MNKTILFLAALILPFVAAAQQLAPKANGGTTARYFSDIWADRLNVKDYGAKCDGSTDDSAAFDSAVARSNTLLNAGTMAVIYVPAGICVLKSTTIRIFQKNGGIIGDGQLKSIIKIDPAYSGDVFSWSDAWAANNYPIATTTTGTVNPAQQKSGPIVSGLTFIGDRSSSNVQTLFHFYDRNDYAFIDNVDVFYFPGSVIRTGDQLNTVVSFPREWYVGRLRVANSGNIGKPVLDFYASATPANLAGATGGTPMDFNEINIYAPFDIGIYIHNDISTSGMRQYNFNHLRIEGVEGNSSGITTDLMKIGNSSGTGQVYSVHMSDAQLINPYTGAYALHLSGGLLASNLAPYDITFKGDMIGSGITGNLGGGILIDAAKQSYFQVVTMSVAGTSVATTNDNTYIGGGIRFNGLGGEVGSWTWSISNATVGTTLQRPAYGGVNVSQLGTVALSGSSIVAGCPADSTTTCGNARGAFATDLQTGVRSNAVQVASGSNSFAAGVQNVVSGQFAAAIGNNNSVSGSTGFGQGKQANDRSRTSAACFADGGLSGQGKTQACIMTLSGTTSTTSAIRLVQGGGGTANTTNCANLPPTSGIGSYAITVDVTADDITTTTNSIAWQGWLMKMSKGNTVGSTTLTNGGTVSVTAVPTSSPYVLANTSGTVTGATIAATADTTNACLNLTFTPPTGNTDTWNVSAVVRSSETTN